jgi:putative phosphoribosyl transferase
VRGRTVLLVDDGLATGLTVLAAVQALQRRGAGRIVVAAPIASGQAVALLRRSGHDVEAVVVSDDMRSIGEWYRDFHQVPDEEVLAVIADAAADPPGVVIDAGPVRLRGDLSVPPRAAGLVVFAHGSGSSRRSPRNRAVARRLREAGLGTLLVDLLAQEEEGRRDLVFDIDLLARRLEAVVRWARTQPAAQGLPVGLFGASTGAAAALVAAAALGDVPAVVSRGGRPDLAGGALPLVRSATLLIVGSRDGEVLELNRLAAARMRAPVRLEVVPGAGHLFEEAGTLEAVAELSARWFREHLEARVAAGRA